MKKVVTEPKAHAAENPMMLTTPPEVQDKQLKDKDDKRLTSVAV